MLEIQAARLAALRASDEEIEALARAHADFRRQVEMENPGLEEDLMFHIKIAECSKNSVLRSLISLITPDVITLSKNLHNWRDGRFLISLKEHEAILRGLQAREPERAAKAMTEHMRMFQLQCQARQQ